MGKKEDISDLIKDEAYEDKKFKKGLVLKFQWASLKITRVDRKNKRTWAEHITLVDMMTGMSHYGHNIDLTGEPAVCTDCEVPLFQEATEEGIAQFNAREDAKDARKQENKSHGKTKKTKSSPSS